jgi:hypothetical protein
VTRDDDDDNDNHDDDDDNNNNNNNNNIIIYRVCLGKINDNITTNLRQVVYVNYNVQCAQKFILDKLEEILIQY